MSIDCPHCDCPDRTHCQCKVSALTANRIREQVVHAPSVKSELEIARREMNYIAKVQELRENSLNLVMVSREIELFLRSADCKPPPTMIANANWLKVRIDKAEKSYYELKEICNA